TTAGLQDRSGSEKSAVARLMASQRACSTLSGRSGHAVSGKDWHDAGIAQLVEHDLAKVGVASSSLVSRSNVKTIREKRLDGRVVMQRTATPYTPVRFRLQPPLPPSEPHALAIIA